MSDIIYKYTGQEGADKILSTGTLRFTRASELNDPFDVYIDDVLGMDLKEFYQESAIALLDLIESDPLLLAKKIEENVQETMLSAAMLKTFTKEQKSLLLERAGAISEHDQQFQEVKRMLENNHAAVVTLFKNYGVLCATKNPNNLLMWAHYTDSHRGAVLGFKPDVERDSFLRLMEPVRYSDERPFLFEHPSIQLHQKEETPTMELAEQANKRILYTKSTEWSYEQEYRVVLPDAVTDGEIYHTLRFKPHELVELRLGNRMVDRAKVRLISLAKLLNPDVKVYATGLVKRKYALEFSEIA